MLQQDKPDDYVIATGKTHTVRDMCKIAFDYAGLDYRDYVVIDEKFFRPCEVDSLNGDPSKAETELSWIRQHSFSDMIAEMTLSDLKRKGVM